VAGEYSSHKLNLGQENFWSFSSRSRALEEKLLAIDRVFSAVLRISVAFHNTQVAEVLSI
jgi:hypothetical protein